jgi:dTDP-4-amino-4,6-dideoxygalactose transaminase
MWTIPLFDLNYDYREEEAVIEVLRSKWLSSGAKTAQFENLFSEYLGGGIHCIACSNGTAALHMALTIAEIMPGDEVILPGLTFVADLNVVMMTGAVPVLADSKSLDDWNISPLDVASKITPRTKALIIVHYAGYPCEMDEMIQLCRKNNIVLIEDVAHAIGAEYNRRKCGTIGDIGCFSFFSNKNLSVGEGGMLATFNSEAAKKSKLLRSHGMTSMTIDRHSDAEQSYDVLIPGFNYRFDELRSALGIIQLQKLDSTNHQREQLVQKYLQRLENVKGISVPFRNISSNKNPSYHIFPILVSAEINRTEFRDYLKRKGIQTSIHYPAFSQFTYYKNIIKSQVEIAETISKRAVTLPLFSEMTNEQVDTVVDTIIEFLDHKRTK